MKKSIYATAGLAAAALVLAACGAAPENEDPAGDTGAEGVDQEFMACMISDEGGWHDASFNESGYEGLTRAAAELGVSIQDAESTDPAQYAGNVDAMVQEGCDLTFGVGFALEDDIQAGAEANEDINFALIDSAFSDDEGNPVDLPNAKPVLFNTHEAAYLAGYLAAGMTETGTVGTYGGRPFPSVTIFMDGFVDGVAGYNDTHGTDVEVLGWDKESQNGSMTGDFENPENGYNTTQQFIADGADVILPVAGPVGSGSLRAADEHEGIMVIWVDADGYEQPDNEAYGQYILTSVLKMIGNSVFDTIEAAAAGEFDPTPYVGTLENGGVDIAPYHDFEDQVPDELKSEIDELREQIISGELQVDSPSAVEVG
ncbi:BMP family lipoprotein [Pseudactinotalea sp. Z1739]|uniref:BMP family lipoprotein n=1 Tax=Pseudactinotalea sp. Z1739 TaxID=3413028 RepID=UPI003C7C55DF